VCHSNASIDKKKNVALTYTEGSFWALMLYKEKYRQGRIGQT
jgi:hypothetical protein